MNYFVYVVFPANYSILADINSAPLAIVEREMLMYVSAFQAPNTSKGSS